MPYTVDTQSIWRYSLRKFVESWLKDTNIWGAAWNVYFEAQLRSPTFVPTSGTNHIYLLDAQVTYKAKDLPIVVLEFPDFYNFGFELGDNYGAYRGDFNLIWMGRNRTEPNLLAGKWSDSVREIALLDPVTGVTPQRNGTNLFSKIIPIGPGERLWSSSVAREGREKFIFQGTLTNVVMTSGMIYIA